MKEEKILALQVNELDNVATVFTDVKANTIVEVRDKKGNQYDVEIQNDIPYGHKLAVRNIKKGEEITKYGEEIGLAIVDIKKGDYVHIHNIESMRGRGDWAMKEVENK